MTHIAEEYKVNRLRGITQMLEMSDRQEGRGQEPWIQKKIMKDLLRENPYLKTVQEMKNILKTELKVEVQEAAERYKPWTMQTGMAEQAQMKLTKRRKTLQPAELTATTIKREEVEIPTHLIQMYERHGNTLEEATKEAHKRMTERNKIVEK